MAFVWQLLESLPALIKLFLLLHERQQEEDRNARVAHDLNTIHEAFRDRDPNKLRALFAGNAQ